MISVPQKNPSTNLITSVVPGRICAPCGRIIDFPVAVCSADASDFASLLLTVVTLPRLCCCVAPPELTTLSWTLPAVDCDAALAVDVTTLLVTDVCVLDTETCMVEESALVAPPCFCCCKRTCCWW